MAEQKPYHIKYENLKISFVLLVILISIRFWSFQLIPERTYNLLEAAVGGCLLIIVIYNLRIFLAKGLNFKINFLLFLLLPLLSVIGADLYHDQPAYLTLLLIRGFLFWLFYLVLHIFDIPNQKIIRLLIFVGLVWIMVTVIQQFTYPIYYFFTRSDETKSIERGGVYRYMVTGFQYASIVLFYFYYKYLTTKKVYTLIFIAIALLGVYYSGTRQSALAVVACMFIGIFYLQGIAKWRNLLIVSSCFAFISIYYFYLFAEFVELTNTQLDDEDYIRYISFNFYLNDYWPHWSAKLIGNGKPHELTDYGQEMEVLSKQLGLFRSDVGIVGAYNTYGIFYVLNIVWVNFKGILLKIHDNKDKYLKLFFFNSLFLILLSEGYANVESIPFFCIIFYLVDKSLMPNISDTAPRIEKKLGQAMA